MIILFHCLSIMLFRLLRSRKKIKQYEVERYSVHPKLDSTVNPSLEQELECNFRIYNAGPVYLQRYEAIYKASFDERWRTKISSLVDFGCNKFQILGLLKQLERITKIYLVDIDKDTLEERAISFHPQYQNWCRKYTPLEVTIFAGSVSDPDYRLRNIDVVTAVELIEHLYPDVLEAFPYNIFNYIKPKLVMLTTPNADFNVLFSDDCHRFRHYDHKFEWTREQFEDWCNNIAIRFPNYLVSFSGIGDGPPGTEHLGQCSQMALFFRKDLIEEEYLLVSNESTCLCDIGSLCKSSSNKLLCSCVCEMCSPSESYGICTYSSCSNQAYSYESDGDPSINDYYTCIKQTEYPFFGEDRTEEEILRFLFTTNVIDRAKMRGLYFDKEMKKAVIPLQTIMSAVGYSITHSEAEKLLRSYGYTVEVCRVQGTDITEPSVIVDPVMEELPGTSEASGYDSDFENCQLNEESLSDWDEPYVKKESGEACEDCKDVTCMEGTTTREEPAEAPTDIEDDKKHQDALFDSGYQKSLSLQDDSPQSPIEELEESDVFEDTTSTPSLTSEDNKLHLKKASTLEKHSLAPPPPPDFAKFKFDLNRINEMDKFHNIPSGRTFFNHFVSPPEVLKRSFLKDKDSLPGPSSSCGRKRKKPKKTPQNNVDEESPFEDVKSITNCLIENTLNKLNVKEDKQNLIEYVEPLEQEPGVYQPVEPPILAIEDAPALEEVRLVENGDLANNNRDGEGNNYIAQEEAVENIGNDIANDNLEIIEPLQLPPAQEENANDNNNRDNADRQIIEDPVIVVAEEGNIGNAENGQAADNLIGEASREALFDPNSEQDSLDDFEIPSTTPVNEANVLSIVSTGNNVVFIGVHPTPEENEGGYLDDQNSFPHWLLQILGSQVIVDGEAPATNQEEPHFYCQGDGLGVHPSVIAVEIDEEEDTTESSNNTADTAELEQGPSSQDMSSLPDDSQIIPLESHETEEQPVASTAAVEHSEFVESNSSSDVGATGSA